MPSKITILVENTAPVPDLIGEYGFAALVEHEGGKYLFDTGSKDALLKNAQVLGIHLQDIDGVIISHGHFDHTGALLAVIASISNKKIYAHKDIFLPRPLPVGPGIFREIGCKVSQDELLARGAEFNFIEGFTRIRPGIYLTGEIPRSNDFEDVGGNFKVKIGDELVDDQLADDMALVIDEEDGLIIVSGCAHAGMINTIDYAVQKTGKTKIKAYIGGTHLMSASRERIDKTIARLESYDIEKVIVCHCTGFYAASVLHASLGYRLIKGETGMIFTF
ncbi:7,8-dihydropterin-6-yl-methyl-4-(beta-D-ribofuranosyl)aminobenzene 5'-phosphate synthase [Thermosyntropha lipolytica DSM 11003]|uniref:7,8-dihydropterin-6-yl-methyl-4-(Beta-D-ribofuranosyl)aminobenzene 5'-phosphate synthase n=1 Tax=Thermosyntropha lipolytica DSM 11003 TaxID=1123382 RepID=A0A1M5KT78_9FIRM|nr:MBL fold metallo-hydrolase [Thermosyntropha lipolytica]SHG56004.1 7,8-dihydropterin-6-yl-methyl-4-(beta-D-ribofuranosyl)aminobenzene 5'-phosphate synthase [Thermosyntropha lipolytica DSM 11003]